MDEPNARARLIQEFDVPRETMESLEALIAAVRHENERQNLVSRGSLHQAWQRHVLDSAQLVRWAPSPLSSWIDLGTGGGFPGLVIALLHPGPLVLVEERKLRADFLRRAVAMLGIGEKTEVIDRRAERIERRVFDVISARAFAPLPRLLDLASRFSTIKTRWILPKGRNARSELESAESSWQGDFRIEPSLTDPDAGIVVAEGVRRKRG